MSAVYAMGDGAHAIPKFTPRRLGLVGWGETILDAVIIGHVVKWAVSAAYFLVTQMSWGFKYQGTYHQWWYLKPVWDNLPSHVGNWLAAVHIKVPWLFLASTQAGWVDPRHYARDTVIGLFAGIGANFLLAKAKQYPGKEYSWMRFAGLPVATLVWAIPGLVIGTLMIVFVPGVVESGVTIPSNGGLWGQIALDINQFVQNGAWQPFVLGLLGSQLFGKRISLGPADTAQWFFAGRKADKIREARNAGRALPFWDRVILGTRAYRDRVNFLVDNDIDSPDHGVGVTRAMVGAAGIVFILSIIGFYLTTFGPAAHA